MARRGWNRYERTSENTTARRRAWNIAPDGRGSVPNGRIVTLGNCILNRTIRSLADSGVVGRCLAGSSSPLARFRIKAFQTTSWQ